MFLCLVFAVYSADVHQPPKYTTVSVANAYEFMYSTNNWTDTITAEQYSKVPNSYFILRQPGDLDDGFGADGFFEITGTPQEIAEFRANAAVMTQVTNKTFQQLKSEGSSVYVVELKKSATYAQAATFWVTIVFFIILSVELPAVFSFGTMTDTTSTQPTPFFLLLKEILSSLAPMILNK